MIVNINFILQIFFYKCGIIVCVTQFLINACTHYHSAGDAVTTELVRYGLRVGVVVLPANHMLKTEQALKFVGPAAFGFDIPYQEPKPFPV